MTTNFASFFPKIVQLVLKQADCLRWKPLIAPPMSMFKAGLELVLILAVTASTGGQQAGPKPPPGDSENSDTRRPVASAEVVGLIQQLGSKDFKQRQAASKTLEAISYPALEALRKAAAQDKDAECRRRSAALAQRIENHLDALTAEYRAFGLPFPPPSAKLAAYPFDDSIKLNGKRETKTYGLVFLIRPGSENQWPTIIQGTDQIQIWPIADLTVIEPEAAFSREIGKPSPTEKQYRLIEKLLREGRICFFYNGFPSARQDWRLVTWPIGGMHFFNDGLSFAIQCKARGWDRLGQTVFDYYQKMHSPPRDDLIQMAWCYWYPKLHEPGTDWRLIAEPLKAICAADKSIYEPEHRAILRSLEAALVPSKAKPGSIAAMIDDLMQCQTTCVPFGEGDADPRGSELVGWIGMPDGPDPRFLRLVMQGFDAVPELIEHLDDKRLTRMYFKGQLKVPVGYQFLVNDVVSDLLNGLADDELGRGWLDRFKGYTVDKARAQAWWEKVKRVGEENYLIQHVLSLGEHDRLPASQLKGRRSFEPEGRQWPNSQLLWVMFEKYPQRLPQIYHTALDKTEKIVSWPLAYAIRRSRLAREKKLELLLYGCKHKELRHRAAALWQLKELDKELFMKNLIDTLDGLPTSSKQPPWECSESLLAVIVRETNDPRAWQALLKAAKRAEVGLRLEILGQLETTNATAPQRWQRAKFLAEFLDDESVREGKGRLYEVGPSAEVETYEIEVRNFAAIAIGRQLKLLHAYPGDADAFYPSRYLPEPWSALRGKVRGAIK
jgi:hypothetical protein